MAGLQTIDWFFFGMARYLLTAETRDDWMAEWAQEQRPDAPAGVYPPPAARVVALDDLDAARPAGTARATPAQRRRVLDERLRQITRMQRS